MRGKLKIVSGYLSLEKWYDTVGNWSLTFGEDLLLSKDCGSCHPKSKDNVDQHGLGDVGKDKLCEDCHSGDNAHISSFYSS